MSDSSNWLFKRSFLPKRPWLKRYDRIFGAVQRRANGQAFIPVGHGDGLECVGRHGRLVQFLAKAVSTLPTRD